MPKRRKLDPKSKRQFESTTPETSAPVSIATPETPSLVPITTPETPSIVPITTPETLDPTPDPEPIAEVNIEPHIPSDADDDDADDPQTLENHQTVEVPIDSDDPMPDPDLAGADEVSGADEVAGGVESDPESIQKLLEPFPKDQLVELLRDAAVSHRDVLEAIHKVADADPSHRKIFVHGLGWDTSNESLAAAFKQYGEIEDCKAVIDKVSGKSKGYGFILFKHRGGARRALVEPQKKLGNRVASCQLATAGPAGPPAAPVSEYTQRKIFVSNVGADIDPQKLLQFFSQFGEIEEGPMGLDKVTGKPRGFTLFVYKTLEGSKKALEEPHKNFEGYTFHCQKAIDGPKMSKSGFNLHQGGAPSSRGGGSGFMGGHHASQDVGGHLMAPPAGGMGHLMAPSTPVLNPALGQALTALLASQGAGLGASNIFGGAGINQAVQGQMGLYGNQPGAVGGNMNPGMMGGYGAPAPMHGGYGNAQMGQGNGECRDGTGECREDSAGIRVHGRWSTLHGSLDCVASLPQIVVDL